MVDSNKSAATKSSKSKIGRPKKTGRPKKGSPKDLARREREEHGRLYHECLEKYKRYQRIVHDDLLEKCPDEAVEILSYLVEKDYPHCRESKRTNSIQNFSGEFLPMNTKLILSQLKMYQEPYPICYKS